MSKLGHQINEFSEDHVTAMIMIMNIMPFPVLKLYVQKLGPILIKALGLKDSHCVSACLRILNKLLAENNEYFSNYLSHIVEKLLNLAQSSLAMVSEFILSHFFYNLVIFDRKYESVL